MERKTLFEKLMKGTIMSGSLNSDKEPASENSENSFETLAEISDSFDREEAQERGALARDMAKARDALDYNKRERFKKQRIQELVERDLNSHLLTVDTLETEVALENPDIEKHSVSFEDADITVYDLKGLPFSILSTTVDYRKSNKSGEIGTETFREILENPAIWSERRDEAEKASGFGTRDSNARGDTISASYWNSERNIDSHVRGELIYGFSHIQADSIIMVCNGDGGTSNMAGQLETTLGNPDVIKQLEGAGGTRFYNEVLLRRYTENGMPKKPDYIIVENGQLTEVALAHAKYFHIPIINIERSAYDEKAQTRGEEIIDSISEDDSYEELDKKLSELLSMDQYKGVYHTLNRIGRGFDIPQPANLTPLEEQCFEISKMEQIKRLNFIRSTLEDAVDKLESATGEGVFISQPLAQFEDFSVSIQDVWNQTRSIVYSDSKDSYYSLPGNCNWISASFKLKGSSRYIETTIYDGERVFEADEALANGSRKKEDIDNADSSFYNLLEPVVRRYFTAFRENQTLRPRN